MGRALTPLLTEGLTPLSLVTSAPSQPQHLTALHLQVRLAPGPNPLRVVLDGSLRVHPACKMLRAEPNRRPTAVAVTRQRTLCSSEAAMRAAAMRAAGVRVLAVPQDAGGRVPLKASMQLLQERLGVRSVMVEGGTQVIASCALEGAAHRVVLTLAPRLTHGTRPRFEVVHVQSNQTCPLDCPLD